MISILCFTIVLASGLYSVAADDDVAVAGDLPVTGFFSGRVKSGSSVGFKSFRRVQGMAFCNTLEFQNLPDPNYAPFAGGSTFKLITGKLYNEKLAWSNGLEYLSYVLTGNGANWIVGNDPGIDNGYLFINADGKLVPVQQETASNHWFWLMQGTWQQQPPLRLVCIDEKSDSPPYYYIVEYYDEATRAMAQSYLLPFIADLADSGIGAVGTEGIIDPHGSRFSGPVYLNRTTSEWDSVTDLQSVAEMGKPYMVTDSAGKSSLGVLVNEEQSSTGGYMLTFKKYSFQQIEIKKKRINFADWKPNEQTIPDDEVVVEIDSRGKPTPDFVVDGLSSSVKKNYLNSVRTTLDGIEEGDYLWLWYHSLDCMDDDCNNSFISSSGGIKHFFDAEKNSMVDQLLLKCISRTPSKATFLAFPSDRRDTMHRTSLSLNSDLLEMTFQHDGKKNGKFLNPLISFMGLTNLHVSSIFYIGKDVVDYIRKYLYSKENRHPTLSSCYFYHAAVSLPQPLIYAAEIVCVLIGAKPVTMIQYTTPSDHQWRFPLVQELTRAVVSASKLLGEEFEVTYDIYRYRTDETLMIYRRSRSYIAESLMPMGGVAQALHPVPYPDNDHLQRDWEAQIYNSWWNGYVLGYPEYFVDSYCESFHNGLSLSEKIDQIQRAKREVEEYFNKVSKPIEVIRIGLDPPITEAQFELLKKTMLH